MQIVLFTALGVGGATVIGAVVGFLFRRIGERFSSLLLVLAIGVHNFPRGLPPGSDLALKT